jgi:long-chain acyl-CoA synthetase
MSTQSLPPFTTLPGLLQQTLQRTCNAAALNWREGGYWRRMSTEEFAGQVRRFSLGLTKLGLKPGDCVGILANPSPWWLIADFAIVSAGGISVPLFPTMSQDHLAFAIDNVSMRHLVVTDETSWALARPLTKRLDAVITKGIHADRGHHVEWQSVLEMGDDVSAGDPFAFAQVRDAVTGDQPATIIHTSGSTGRPKGVVLTHGNLCSQIQGAAEVFPLHPSHDRALSCLPLAHVFERMVMYYYVATGVPVHFCDDIALLGAMMRSIHPTVMTAVPRLIEKVHARIAADVAGGGLFKRLVGSWALDRADHHEPRTDHELADTVADQLLYKKVRAAFGGQLRYFIVGGAALADGLHRFLINVGVPVYLGYGLTEASPVAAVNRPGEACVGTVGRTYPGVEVRIGEHEEVLVRGPNVMRGYHNDPVATSAAIDGDGWLHTGDCGRFDDVGRLIITGRIKDLCKTSNGKYVLPVDIEQRLMQHPLVDQAMVVAEGRRFVSALLFTAPETLLAARRNANFEGSDAAFVAAPEQQAEFARHLDAVNAGLDHWEQVKKWVVITDPPSITNDQLTPTLKLRRHVITAVYADRIEQIYREAEAERPEPAPP